MYFHSREARCKTPFGAVKCGTKVTLTMLLDENELFSQCALLMDDEFAGTHDEIPMKPCKAGFTCTCTAPKAGTLVWYSFRLTDGDGNAVFYGKNGPCGPGEAAAFQLTVYDGKSPVPDWFGKGVSYQIFPDRFCRLGLPDVSGMVGGRVLHRRWEDQPVFRPDGDGVVRNCDFFGGSLRGILSKLDYLQSLSITTLYLNPIFMAASNHRYDTADYMTIDPLLGTENDFRELCTEAAKRGIRVMLDGVFNHTGSDSIYFNARGSFPGPGAAQSQDSPYYKWYSFRRWPDDYDAWWGTPTLPAVNEHDPDYRAFIFDGRDSVVRHWLRCGASAWRLDVADELPDDFIAGLRKAMVKTDPDSFLLGEVWEDASNKVAYSQRRKYFLGGELCGVMNYPFRNACIDYVRGGDAAAFRETMETLRENYPRQVYYSLMNILGTHDTARILTVLGADNTPDTKEQRAEYRLDDGERYRGMRRLRLAAMLLYSFPGSPTLFYGDEAGMQGFEDPLNRGTYPWGGEDGSLLRLFRALGRLRKTRVSLQEGDIEYLRAEGCMLILRRSVEGESTLCALNAGDSPVDLTLDWAAPTAADGATGQIFLPRRGKLNLTLPPLDGVVLV